MSSLSPQEFPEVVTITLLLAGGQQYTVSISSDDSLLQDLFEVLTDWEGKRVKRLFQIPIRDGQAVLAFPSDRLMGMITEPPLILQQTSPEPPLPVNAPADTDPLVSKYVQLDRFLTSKQQRRLLSYVLQHEADFVPTTTYTGKLDYRKSTVLYAFPEFAELLSQRIQAVLPDVLTKLGLPLFSPSQIESQLTAHNDGHYYKLHNDNGSPDTASRELTYVYYFHREPKPFKGGELLVYDSKVENNFYVKAETFKTVEPRNNSIVFFLSRYMHEVLPIHCPSRAFADSRFTINGWIRR
jgi:SM-20-related protein